MNAKRILTIAAIALAAVAVANRVEPARRLLQG